MKKYILTLLALVMVGLASATDLTGKRIYVNPGHGSFGPNDRPMATIPYPNLSSTGMPDTCGFYETNTNLWKCQYLRDRLVQAGATVVMSREFNGPWPYEKVNGEYPGYSWNDYQNRSDYTMYNKNLSEICEEVESGNYDLFISVHSNAATDGSATNYPLFLYRGADAAGTTFEQTCKTIGQTIWPYRWDMMGAGYDPASYYSATQMNVRGDTTFYGSASNRTSSYSGQTYRGYLGVLKHGVPGGLWEGYFHTYQPARHRALNHDHCNMEGIGYFRGIMDYFGATPDTKGYICGTVKDMDNKMNHGLYKFAARTNDQWVPCNGATVHLLGANGDTLQSYQVDENYNGTFVFYNLQPGTYHLAASCPGYYDLDAEQLAADVVVEANKTTFPFLFLRDTTWAPPTVVYETYPDKSMGVTGLDGKYNFSAAQAADFSAVVAGKVVRQVLVRDDNDTYVLALDTAAKASFIYRINTLTGALKEEVSTAGTQGDIYPVFNIAFTADSILVGGNYNLNHYTPNGSFRAYYWDMTNLSNAPTQLMESTLAGNYINANVGRSFAVAGPLGTLTIYTDAMTTGSSQDVRVMQFQVDSFNITSSCRNQEAGVISLGKYGDYTAVVSPVADDRTMLLGAIKGAEYGWGADAQAPQYGFMLPATKGGQAFKYGGQAVLAAPAVENGVLTINMYNVSAGRAQLGVTTTNIADSLNPQYMSVKPLAAGKDIVLYLATEDHIYRYTTAGVEQPSFRNIYAYDLKAELNADSTSYALSFSLNTEAVEANVFIYTLTDSLVAVLPVESPALTGNVVNVALPIEGLDEGVELKWMVQGRGLDFANWSIAEVKTAASMGMTRVFNAVNVYPETEHFGEIYLMDRAGASAAGNGMYVMNPDLTLQNTTPYKGQQSVYGSPYRFGIASDGFVYVGDWSDGHSGVYVVDPADPAGSHTTFFAGTQNSSGLWKNAAGVEEGSSTPSVYVYGEGADTKLLVYNEDPGSTLPMNGLCVYNIGQPDGSILRTWDGAPSAMMTFQCQANTNGNVWGCSQGVWVSQHRAAGNNNSVASSLQFYNWAGERTFAGHVAPTTADGQLVIDGSLGSCFALSADEKTIILRGTDKNFMIFDVEWNESTPTLTLRSELKNTYTGDFDVLQMNWDYAGNLVFSGNMGLGIVAVPKEENTCITPARSAYHLFNGKKDEPVEPFDHCLYEPAQASVNTYFYTSGWSEDTVSFATVDTISGDVQVSIASAKNERWQAQVKLDTKLDLDPTKLYSLEFSIEADINIQNVTVRMFDKAVMLTDSTTINLVANEGIIYSADSLVGVAGSGVLVFDFGFAPSAGNVRISDIAICEVGDVPEVIYEHLYEIGDNQGWKPSEAIEMTGKEKNVFEGTYEFTATTYFGFITIKPETDDWDLVNANRFGANNDGDEVTVGANTIYTNANAFKVAAGNYTFTVDLNTMTLNVVKNESALDNLNGETKVEKFFRDGQLFIRKNGHEYNANGTMVK
ncbi:MAG: N-acetylmuramoyl-L-alanine amidase [Paludibacteraceae bacterium]|nr:N-acetylmuramoyl-L-alanine amidase [Paludibacteraceae bacterium]